MRKFNPLQALAASFYSKALYQDVGRGWTGAGLGYLALLAGIASLFAAAQIHVAVQKFCTEAAPPIIFQIPEIVITKGELSTPEKKPYFIKEPGTDAVIAIIDASKKEIPAQWEGGARVFVGKTKIAAIKSDAEMRVYDLSGIDGFTLNQQMLIRWLDRLAGWMVPVLLPFLYIGFYIVWLVRTLITSLATVLAAKAMKIDMTYQTAFRLTVVAMTPALFLGLLVGVTGIPFPRSVLLLTRIGFVFFGLNALKMAGGQEAQA
ncbi:MAG: DUF1189 domain-containing protein [Candidatus Omnitrophica bacterium]|nr:DUF1189 domain-containing protein [Candidatus Omnitrophota bacterium]